jgi:hypothetical protein
MAAHAVDLILKLPAGALEGVVERKIEIGIAFVVLRRMADIDLAAFRQSEADIDLEEAALAMMIAGRFQHDAAGRDAAEVLLELADVLGDGAAEVGPRLHPLKVDPNRGFHGFFPGLFETLTVSPRAAPASLIWLKQAGGLSRTEA